MQTHSQHTLSSRKFCCRNWMLNGPRWKFCQLKTSFYLTQKLSTKYVTDWKFGGWQLKVCSRRIQTLRHAGRVLSHRGRDKHKDIKSDLCSDTTIFNNPELFYLRTSHRLRTTGSTSDTSLGRRWKHRYRLIWQEDNVERHKCHVVWVCHNMVENIMLTIYIDMHRDCIKRWVQTGQKLN